MRPLSLAIEGLTSFRESQEVDFAALDLFVITGPTGAGKSSILDAMTFALYGNVARVNNHELRDLISHGSTYMRVRLDFEVGDAHYRVARRMGRSTHDVTLELVDGDAAVPELDRGGIRAINERLEEIVGLDFSAFTKAVLLPQGAFHEFLKGDKAERRRILMRLLDLNRYERAGQAARREANRLEAILGERLALIESNYRDATDDRMRQLANELEKAQTEYGQLNQARQEGRQVAEIAARAAQAITALTEAATQTTTAHAELSRLETEWQPLEHEHNTASQELTQADAALTELEKALSSAREQLATTIEQTGDSELLARLDAASITHVHEQQELAELEKALRVAREEAQILAAAVSSAQEEQAQCRKAVETTAEALKRAEAAEEIAAGVAECARRAHAHAGLEERRAHAKQEVATLEAHAEDSRKQHEHLQQEHAAVALRSGLVIGDPCPVCTSIVNSLPMSDTKIDALLTAAQEALTTAESSARAAREAAISLDAQCESAAEELERTRAKLPAKTKVPGAEEADAALEQARLSCAIARDARSVADVALEQATAAAAETKAAASASHQKANGMIANRDGVQQRRDAAQTTLEAGFNGQLPDDVKAALTQRRTQLDTAEKERDTAAEQVEGAQRIREAARLVSLATSERIARFDTDFAAARTTARIGCDSIAATAANQSLPGLPEETKDRAKLLAAWNTCCAGHLKAAKDAVKQQEKETAAATKKLTQLAAQAGLTPSSNEPREIEAELERALTAAHGAVVAAEKDVAALKTRIDERTELEKAIVDDRCTRVLFEELARDLRADHFIAFVLEESMDHLADQASVELLRISDDRYGLVADGGNFDVIDHHNADERRSVATLSGGETFLASLSLALALASGLRELGASGDSRLEAMFIDEGFGALDADTLDVVVDALERLREGDRMVGVITHVPALSERIPMGLLVEKDGSSSRITAR